jgi:hypothetical protein
MNHIIASLSGIRTFFFSSKRKGAKIKVSEEYSICEEKSDLFPQVFQAPFLS